MTAAIPNLHTIQTLTSAKAATALNNALTDDRKPLNILIQVNTSGEDSKSGVDPISGGDVTKSELAELSRHILTACPRLHLQGLMTIGSLAESVAGTDENRDFETLKRTRDSFESYLATIEGSKKAYGGPDGKLMLSMGMSSDFEPAIHAGADIVRVGKGIFGERKKKEA